MKCVYFQPRFDPEVVSRRTWISKYLWTNSKMRPEGSKGLIGITGAIGLNGNHLGLKWLKIIGSQKFLLCKNELLRFLGSKWHSRAHCAQKCSLGTLKILWLKVFPTNPLLKMAERAQKGSFDWCTKNNQVSSLAFSGVQSKWTLEKFLKLEHFSGDTRIQSAFPFDDTTQHPITRVWTPLKALGYCKDEYVTLICRSLAWTQSKQILTGMEHTNLV